MNRQTKNDIGNESRQLPFEKLDAYQVAIQLTDLIGALPCRRGCAHPLDQLKRAAISIALNIAEACGRQGADRKRFFGIAKGSALESAAALRILLALNGVKQDDYQTARSYCERLYAMLIRLSRP